MHAVQTETIAPPARPLYNVAEVLATSMKLDL